ncbi:MAG: TonB-dependent receptor domain-containing protein [Bryobacteraceae bacterium]
MKLKVSAGHFVLVSLFVASQLFSQTTSTEVLGTVSDTSGAVIPEAKVTLLRIATGQKRETTTSSSGDFNFPLIEIGEYSVTVQASGFKAQEKRGIVIQLQQKARVNFQLSVGEVAETVEVVASAVALKTEDAAVGHVIDNKRIVELPLNGRNISALAVLTAGVQFGNRQGIGDGSGGSPFPGRMVAVSANGQREINQQISMDGVVATEPQTNTMTFTPSVDAIEEFKVQTSSYSAEYGQNSGAVVQIAMKSGTNQFRGTLYEFLRHDKTAAENYFLNFELPAGAARRPKNALRRNQFGVFLGGPVLLPKIYNGKDRTFWSFNYEGLRQTQESVQEGFWYPEPFRRGDFSALLRPVIRNGRAIRSPIIIFDPLTGEPFRDTQGNITNIIPASRVRKASADFINRFQPLPMFQPEDILDVNARASVPVTLKSNQYFFRIDHQLTSKDKVFVRYATDRSNMVEQVLNPSFPRFIQSPVNNVATQHIHLFSSRVLNEFRYGVHRMRAEYTNPRTNTDFDIDSLGIGQIRVAIDNNRKMTPRETGIPFMFGGIGDRDASLNATNSWVHQFADNLSINRGSHNFKMGGEIRVLQLNHQSTNNPRGSITCCPGGYELAGFLLGQYSGSLTAEGFPLTQPRQKRSSLYFLDDWKATRKLTLNLGIRWDYFPVATDANGGWRNLRLDQLTQASDGRRLPTLVPSGNVAGAKLFNGDNRFFMPRVGLAYRLTDRWVLRMGGGWFVNAQHLDNYQILSRAPPRSGNLTFQYVEDTAQVIPYAYAGQTYNISTRAVRPGTLTITPENVYPGSPNVQRRTGLILIPPDNKYSSHVQWSFDIQRALPFQAFLTVAYVGSKTSHIDTSWANFNSPDPSPNSDVDGRRPWQAYVDPYFNNEPRGLSTIRYLDSYANGFYHGLQTTVEKRYSKGLVVNMAYTFSKSMGEGYERNGGEVSQDPRNRRADRQRYFFDTTHNANINYVYEMPFLNRFKGVLGGIIGGWQTNGIVTMRTGFPFNFGGGGNLNTGGPSRPDRIADGRLAGAARRALWFDITAFRRTECNIASRQDLCHYGNAAKDAMIGPPSHNFDLSIYKNWRISPLGEQGRLQFRAEFFNAFNTPHYGTPNGISFTTQDSVVPDGARNGEIRGLVSPMRIIQFGMKLYF